MLIEVVDELFETAHISEDLLTRLSRTLTPEQVLDVLLMSGWYHAISFAANGARLEPEVGAPRFADVV